MFAAEHGHLPVMQYLTGIGADVAARDDVSVANCTRSQLFASISYICNACAPRYVLCAVKY